MNSAFKLFPKLCGFQSRHCWKSIDYRKRYVISSKISDKTVLPSVPLLFNSIRNYAEASLASSQENSSHDGFLSRQHTRFDTLGINEHMQRSVERAGLNHPTTVQALAVPNILDRQCVVLAAETGSGKTLAYLLPIIQNILASTDCDAEPSAHRRKRNELALVLCSSSLNCQQVVDVAHSLTQENGTPLVKAAQISAIYPPPLETPSIVVCTPASLIAFIKESGPKYGRLWTKEGLQAAFKYVVFDEADMLLTSIEKDTKELLEIFKLGDRRKIEAKVIDELGMSQEEWSRLPYSWQTAAWQGGSRKLLDMGFEKQLGDRPVPAEFGPYWTRQYIFVAATMPTATKGDVGTAIQRMFPKAVWLSGANLHLCNANVKYDWQEVDDETRRSALLDVIRSDTDLAKKTGNLLVFTNNTYSAEMVADALTESNVQNVVFHADRLAAERKEALARIKTERGLVLVATDAAARGLDFRSVTHVLQAEFPKNVVDFIHRVGRTGRAGTSGHATTFYRQENRWLAEAIRSMIENGQPLEQAFSRNRSLSRSKKRAGNIFVPRTSTWREQTGKGGYSEDLGTNPPQDRKPRGDWDSRDRGRGLWQDRKPRGDGESQDRGASFSRARKPREDWDLPDQGTSSWRDRKPVDEWDSQDRGAASLRDQEPREDWDVQDPSDGANLPKDGEFKIGTDSQSRGTSFSQDRKSLYQWDSRDRGTSTSQDQKPRDEWSSQDHGASTSWGRKTISDWDELDRKATSSQGQGVKIDWNAQFKTTSSRDQERMDEWDSRDRRRSTSRDRKPADDWSAEDRETSSSHGREQKTPDLQDHGMSSSRDWKRVDDFEMQDRESSFPQNRKSKGDWD